MTSSITERSRITTDASRLVTVAAESAATIWVAPDRWRQRSAPNHMGRYDGISGIATAPGGRILYRTVESGTANIWVVDEDGSGAQLTTEGVVAWPVATADGDRRSSLARAWDSGRSAWTAKVPDRLQKTAAGRIAEVDAGRPVDHLCVAAGRLRAALPDSDWRRRGRGDAGLLLHPAIGVSGRQTGRVLFPGRTHVGGRAWPIMPIDGKTPTRQFRRRAQRRLPRGPLDG